MTKKKIQTEPLALEGPLANEVKEESSEEKTVEEPKSDKIQKSKTITCPNCKKNMLEKTFKYYRSLKCHPTSISVKPAGSVAQLIMLWILVSLKGCRLEETNTQTYFLGLLNAKQRTNENLP